MMDPRRIVLALLLCGLSLASGCRPGAPLGEPHHVGAKINIPDFLNNTIAYKGKAVMLSLRVDEPIVPAQGQSLRDYAGREAKFTTRGPRGERLDLSVRIPQGLSVPEVGNGDEVFVTFVCTRGSLRQGNEARAIQLP
jgi:hypothetical protein